MITSNDSGVYTCHDCGHTWKARDRYVWWPVRVAWQSRLARKASRGHLSFHGWQVGWDRIEQRVFGGTLRIGRLLIKFGRSRELAAEGSAGMEARK